MLRTEEGTVQPTAVRHGAFTLSHAERCIQGSQLNYVTRIPLGVCALLSSFNHPLLISIKKLAAALAGGNSVVLKPSELAPLAVLELGGMASEAGRTSSPLERGRPSLTRPSP